MKHKPQSHECQRTFFRSNKFVEIYFKDLSSPLFAPFHFFLIIQLSTTFSKTSFLCVCVCVWNLETFKWETRKLPMRAFQSSLHRVIFSFRCAIFCWLVIFYFLTNGFFIKIQLLAASRFVSFCRQGRLRDMKLFLKISKFKKLL